MVAHTGDGSIGRSQRLFITNRESGTSVGYNRVFDFKSIQRTMGLIWLHLVSNNEYNRKILISDSLFK